MPRPPRECKEGKYKCNRCNGWFLPEQFYKTSGQKPPISHRCKKCDGARTNNYYWDNQIAQIISNMNNRARRQNIPGEVTPTQWEQVLSLYNGRCVYCGKKEDLEIDHIYPLSSYHKGDWRATNTPENIVPACKYCNGAKRHYSVEEFLKWLHGPKKWHLKFDLHVS